MAIVLLALTMVGRWQSGGSAAQVQVPMFYDAHYLFPRAWTQEQAAPGIPEPAPLALYGSNRINQTFTSGSDQLSMVALWLTGAAGQEVEVAVVDDLGAARSGKVILGGGVDGRTYYFGFDPFEDARGRLFRVTMAAPEATVERPVVTRSVGGDRLGGMFSLNEYDQPGNMELRTYAGGVPGKWWLEAISAQLLPPAFKLRLEQYKPEAFKGAAFSLLLLATGGLSLLFLIVASPQAQPSLSELSRALGWAAVLVLGTLLLWQIAGRRVVVPSLAPVTTLVQENTEVGKAPAAGTGARLTRDLVNALWTAERFPEARFVSSGMMANLPGIKVPADSRMEYQINMLPGSTLRAGVAAQGEGNLAARVRIEEEYVAAVEVSAAPEPDEGDVTWLEIDLAPWGGQPVRLVLETEGEKEKVDGWWVMPQISSSATWILSDPPPEDLAMEDAGFRFGDTVELVGYEFEPLADADGQRLQLTLYWRPLAEIGSYAKVFVHVLDDQQELISQSDGQPVNNAYPFPLWQTGSIVKDVHILELPDQMNAGQYTVAVGLYDVDSLQRWTATDGEGRAVGDGSAVLTTFEVTP